MKKGFSLIEILIAAVLLGILATIVISQLHDQAHLAKIVAAKGNLRVLRSAIEYYAAQHNGVAPGYSDGEIAPSTTVEQQLTLYTDDGGNTADTQSRDFPFGCYLRKIPENPFNNKTRIKVLGDNEPFPESADGSFGWIYKPATRVIRLDWPGRDKDDVRYYDY